MDSTNTRLLLLLAATGYRGPAYAAAATRLGVEFWVATDLPASAARFGRPVIGVDYSDPERAASALFDGAPRGGFSGVLATDETTALVGALLARRMGLRGNDVDGMRATRNKRLMRERFARAAVPGPGVTVLEPEQHAEALLPRVTFPCVVKPPMLSGSQGVIRADDARSLVAAVVRIRAILDRHPSPARSDPDFHRLLVEGYMPGREVALEAVAIGGELYPLALFDKPDPLVGPYFEETIYVTPSRLTEAEQRNVVDVATRAAQALGINAAPVHAELRVSETGARMVEVAARSIGGLCSQALESVVGNLEELLIASALGLETKLPPPSAGLVCGRRPAGGLTGAAGVMMIPIPKSGVLRSVEGVAEAAATPGVHDVRVTAVAGQAVRALPEGSSYLGFIFARAEAPDDVEHALRAAHAKLVVHMSPLLNPVA